MGTMRENKKEHASVSLNVRGGFVEPMQVGHSLIGEQKNFLAKEQERATTKICKEQKRSVASHVASSWRAASAPPLPPAAAASSLRSFRCLCMESPITLYIGSI